MANSKMSDAVRISLIEELLEKELGKLKRRQDEDDDLFDSEYTSLAGNGVNCSEAILTLEPVAENIFAIIRDEHTNTIMNNEKNRYGEDFVVCVNCEVSHVQNCGSCFGWGFFQSGGLVNAAYAHEFKDIVSNSDLKTFRSCEECGSDVRGTNG